MIWLLACSSILVVSYNNALIVCLNHQSPMNGDHDFSIFFVDVVIREEQDLEVHSALASECTNFSYRGAEVLKKL